MWQVTDDGLRSLAHRRSPLMRLDLKCCSRVTQDGVAAARRALGLRSGTSLDVSGCGTFTGGVPYPQRA